MQLMQIIGIIAAGNCFVLKPSELATASENILQILLSKYHIQFNK